MLDLTIFSRLILMVLRVRSSNGSFPPTLSTERERECFRLFKEEGSEEARAELIEHNLRLVAHIVKKYSTPQDQDDLISIGTIGLIKAVDSFDPKLGIRFATFAGKCVTNEILMYYRAQKKLASEVSLSETIELDKDGDPLTWGDIISVEDTIADDIFLRLRSERAAILIKQLEPRERKIILLRYGLTGDRPLTQRETAERLGISRSYVSRLEGAALEKLSKGFDGV